MNKTTTDKIAEAIKVTMAGCRIEGEEYAVLILKGIAMDIAHIYEEEDKKYMKHLKGIEHKEKPFNRTQFFQKCRCKDE